MASKVYVRLQILSEVRTPEEISRELGVAYDTSWRIGDLRAKTTIAEKQHGWVLNSALPITADLQDHVQDLLARLAPIADRVKALTSNAVVEFSCVVYEVARVWWTLKRGTAALEEGGR
jgi:Domain of unknown function (DUF4279)